MAFISMIFGAITVLLFIVAIAFVIGMTFLLIGLFNKRKVKCDKKKWPIVCMVIGGLLLLPTVITGVSALSIGVSSVVSKVFPKVYDSIPERWKNEWVSDNQARKEAIQELLDAADRGDKERFAKVFSAEVRKREGFDEALEQFFSVYPVGLSECELGPARGGSSASYDYGDNVKNGSGWYKFFMNGEWYQIWMQFCYENVSKPDAVGVTFFCIENLEAAALDLEYGNNDVLVCELRDGAEVTARLIGGNPFVFIPTPERKLTEMQMTEYLELNRDVDLLMEKIGEPNVTAVYDNGSGTDYYYELMPENGESRYVQITADKWRGDIYDAYICSETKCFYDRKIYSKVREEK